MVDADDPVAAARSLVSTHLDQLIEVTDPAAALRLLTDVGQAAERARAYLAVRLILDDGWTYAQLGRALGTTRQAATKTHGPAVAAELRRRIRQS